MIIFILIILSFVLLGTDSDKLRERNRPFALILIISGLAVSLFLLYTGINLTSTWDYPKSELEGDQVASRAMGRLWIFLIVVKIWPYILIFWGGLSTFVQAVSLRNHFKSKNN